MDTTTNPQNVTSEQFICPNCGGTLQFDIHKQKFTCSACGAENDIKPDSSTVKEYDFSDYTKRENSAMQFPSGVSTVICQTCGAEILFDEHDTAALCPMCGSAQIIAQKQLSGIPPEGVVPFQIDRQDAQEKFKKWIKSRWFAPNKLKRSYGEGRLTGVYIPFWTYDADAQGQYQGRGGEHYYEEDKDGNKVQKTRWYPVSGLVTASFDDIQICASKKNGGTIINELLPYNTIGNTKPFSTAYLSGYKAEKYSIKADEGFKTARSQMESQLRDQARQQILVRYDVAEISGLQASYYNVRYKHVLLPAWIAAFGYSGKEYFYAINGENGSVSGNRPYSAPKIIAFIAVLLAILAGIFLWVNDDDQEEVAATLPQTAIEAQVTPTQEPSILDDYSFVSTSPTSSNT